MALVITITVMPSAGRQAWALNKSGMLKCFLKNPAQKGLANNELMRLLAKIAQVPQNSVTLMQGATSRKKVIKIDTPLTYDQFLALLGIAISPEKNDDDTQQKLW
ncbi:MAG: DUF167 domain-containing protein [Candidatus Babeliales bacterium]